MTKPSALEGIILRGIVPGGNDSARRLAVHFGVFAPWDSKNISTKTVMHDVKEEMTSSPSTCKQRGRDHSLQRDKGKLELQVHEERACERG